MSKSRVITYNFGEDLIAKVSDLLYQDFYRKGKSLAKIACVFGGRRPALFLKKQLAEKINLAFLPPAIFSMDDFMHYSLFGESEFSRASDLELYYLVYQIACNKFGFISKDPDNFSRSLSWAKEIVSFIEQLDLEAIDDNFLGNIQKSAAIGYEVPEGINQLLENIIEIRRRFHEFLREKKLYSRGRLYQEASKKIAKNIFPEFDQIFFCGLYYLNKSEQRVIKALTDAQRALCIFQGSAQGWPALRQNSRLLRQPIQPVEPKTISPKLSFYQGFDTQSQAALAKELLKKIKDKESTLILLPDSQTLIPLLSEAAEELGQFNVSLGYPLSKSSLYALLYYLVEAHQSRKGKKYYSQDYLKVLRHPFIKNMLAQEPVLISRVLVHKIEEALDGSISSSVGGSLFLDLERIEKDRDIYQACQKTLFLLGLELNWVSYQKITKGIHKLLFRDWEKIQNLNQFSLCLRALLDIFSQRSSFLRFPLEAKALDLIYKIEAEFSSLTFAGQPFDLSQIWDIFKKHLESSRISFLGSPLKGIQILGLLETRSLRFRNVLVLDANEGLLPKIRAAEPLIPSEVMLNLGLGRLQKEEEIQRYNFMRLIESAEDVYLIWSKNQAQERSRFVEEILWQKQKESGNSTLSPIPRVSFSLSFPRPKEAIQKTPDILEFLKKSTYSASRINTYLECPLQFYYKYVLGLGKKESLLEGVKDSQVGDFIHQLLFEAYSLFLGKKPVFDLKFKDFFKDLFLKKYEKEVKPRMLSDHFLLKGIIQARLLKFLEVESNRSQDIKEIAALEKEYIDFLDLPGLRLKFKYIIDRIDLCSDNSLLIIDYKTGGRDTLPRRLSSLEKMEFSRQQIRDNIRSFQLPLYSYFTQKRFKDNQVNACIYNLRNAQIKPFALDQASSAKEKALDCCQKALKFILSEIFDLKIPFLADKDSRRCSFCPFVNLCG